jgi:DnaJ-class molecular chaperone
MSTVEWLDDEQVAMDVATYSGHSDLVDEIECAACSGRGYRGDGDDCSHCGGSGMAFRLRPGVRVGVVIEEGE